MASPLHTEDTFFNGLIRVKQNAAGYRFSIDAVILAWHVAPAADAKIIDIGTGCGIIPLILAHRYRTISITGLEVQPQLVALARENVACNGLSHRITIHCQDINKTAAEIPAGEADLVICNPPFRKACTGRISLNPERAIARHEIKTTLADIIAAAGKMLKRSGEVAVIYPATRLADMIIAMRQGGIEPKLLRMIHSRPHDPAKLVLLKGNKKGRPGISVPSPMIIYDDDGAYTPEAQKMFQP